MANHITRAQNWIQNWMNTSKPEKDFFFVFILIVVIVDDIGSIELIELRPFRVLVLIHSASTFHNEKQTNFCRKRQTGTCTVQRSGRYTNRHQMENTKYTTAFRRIAGYKVHASFCSELYIYVDSILPYILHGCICVCMWLVYLKLKSRKRQREGRKIGKFSHRFVVATNNLTMVLAPNYI